MDGDRRVPRTESHAARCRDVGLPIACGSSAIDSRPAAERPWRFREARRIVTAGNGTRWCSGLAFPASRASIGAGTRI